MAVLDPDKVDRIKKILKWHPRGLTISDLASETKMNRNLVAKYLDMLLISGRVEMQVIGAAKVYFLSQRVPISALLEFSKDAVIVMGDDRKILQVNEPVIKLTGMQRNDLVTRTPEDIPSPFMQMICTSEKNPSSRAPPGQESTFCCRLENRNYHFRVNRIRTAFEDGSDGVTFLAEDITSRKMYEEILRTSEARYRGLVRSIGEAIIGTHTDGTITSWNPAAERLFGLKEADVVSAPIRDLLTDPSAAELADGLLRVTRGDTIRRREMRITTRNGRVLDVIISISPVLGENGAVTGASSIVQDITGEKMEQYLRQHEDQYRALVEDLNVGIYRSTGDPRGKFVWGNTALLDILGYPSVADLRDISVVNVFHEPGARQELLEDLRKNRFVKNRILHLKKPDGSPFSVSVTALAEFDEDQNIVFINGIVQDITHVFQK